MNGLDYQFIENLKYLPFVEAIYLFGSRARGDNNTRSDIDIAVKLLGNSSDHWRVVMDIIENADTLLEIDCVDFNKADAKLRERILTQGKLLYERAS